MRNHVAAAQMRILERLAASRDARIAAIATKAAKDVRYHVRRSTDLVVRLGDGTAASRARMQGAADALWPYTGELFAVDEVDHAICAQGIGFDPSALRAPWLAHVERVFARATLAVPDRDAWMHGGGKQGRHGEALGYLLAEMQVLARRHPGARW